MIYIWIPMGFWTSERVQKGYILNFSPDVPCWTDSFLSLQVKDHCKNSPPELLIDYKSVLKQQSFSATSKQSSHTQGTSGSCSLQWTSEPKKGRRGANLQARKSRPWLIWTWQLRAFLQRLFAALEKTNWPQTLTHLFATAANGLFEVYNRIPSTPAHAGENVRCFGTELSNMCTAPAPITGSTFFGSACGAFEGQSVPWQGAGFNSLLFTFTFNQDAPLHHCKKWISFGMYVNQGFIHDVWNSLSHIRLVVSS